MGVAGIVSSGGYPKPFATKIAEKVTKKKQKSKFLYPVRSFALSFKQKNIITF